MVGVEKFRFFTRWVLFEDCTADGLCSLNPLLPLALRDWLARVCVLRNYHGERVSIKMHP